MKAKQDIEAFVKNLTGDYNPVIRDQDPNILYLMQSGLVVATVDISLSSIYFTNELLRYDMDNMKDFYKLLKYLTP